MIIETKKLSAMADELEAIKFEVAQLHDMAEGSVFFWFLPLTHALQTRRWNTIFNYSSCGSTLEYRPGHIKALRRLGPRKVQIGQWFLDEDAFLDWETLKPHTTKTLTCTWHFRGGEDHHHAGPLPSIFGLSDIHLSLLWSSTCYSRSSSLVLLLYTSTSTTPTIQNHQQLVF